MTFNDAATSGFETAARNWLLVVFQFLSFMINFMLAFLIVIIPFVVICIAVGVDVIRMLDGLKNYQYADYANLLAGLAGLAAVLILLIAIYMVAAFVVNVFAIAGTAGGLSRGCKSLSYKTTMRDFLHDGQRLFYKVASLELLMLLYWIGLGLVLAAGLLSAFFLFPEPSDDSISFMRVFALIIAAGLALLGLMLGLALRFLGLTHITLDDKSGGQSLALAWQTITMDSKAEAGHNALGFVALMTGALLIISGLVMGIGILLDLVPVVGMILRVPSNLLTTVFTSFILNAITAAIFTYHLRALPQAPFVPQAPQAPQAPKPPIYTPSIYDEVPDHWDPTFDSSTPPESTSAAEAPGQDQPPQG